MQELAHNAEYEILTPDGWKDFVGVIRRCGTREKSKRIIFSDGLVITASLSHRWYISGKETHTGDLKKGDVLDGGEKPRKIAELIDTDMDEMYDLFKVTGNLFLTDDVVSHNCDELAFVPPTIADAMWTSMRPTLATGGRAIITSTPNSDEDLFATIWKGANDKFDEYGNEREVGTNGFYPFRAYWYEHPDRDENWRLTEIGAIGLGKFNREYACLTGESVVTMCLVDGSIKDMTIADVFQVLGDDSVEYPISVNDLSSRLSIPEVYPPADEPSNGLCHFGITHGGKND